MVKGLKDNRGVALILTISIIGLIVMLTLRFNTFMRTELHAATNLGDGTRLKAVTNSGFNYALAVLFQDALESDFDSLHEAWSDSKILSAEAESMFEGYRLDIQVTDHSGKIQINQIVDEEGNFDEEQKELLAGLLISENFDIEPEEVEDILDAIKDWIDEDNEVTRFGAEDSYYQALDPPYSCRNGPLESLEELLFIKGITRELFYGNSENTGISEYLSVHGEGKVNINTADPLILLSLSDQIDEDMVLNMVEYRENEENDLKDSNWYKQVPEMSHVTIDPNLVTTSSSFFEIRTKTIKDTMVKGIKGLVKRQEGGLRILSWEALSLIEFSESFVLESFKYNI